MIMMAGTPYLNFFFWVLWCQTFIPIHAPMLPPSTANINNAVSLILHIDFLAFHLSMPNVKKVATLMTAS